MPERHATSAMPLGRFEWHDLPLHDLRVTAGSIELTVTPWSDAAGAYEAFRLVLRDADEVQLDLAGKLTSTDLRNLEVAHFKYKVDSAFPTRLTGVIRVLPGAAGYWTISFRRALWELVPVADPGPMAG